MSKKLYNKCNFMVQDKNWNECGNKATYIHKGSMLCYCEEHAKRVIPYAKLEKIRNDS